MIKIPNSLEKEQLKELFRKIAFDDYYQYVNSLNCIEDYLIESNQDDQFEFILCKEKEIYGYIRFKTYYGKIMYVCNCVNFTKESKYRFGKDLLKIFEIFKKNGYMKVGFLVAEGNPAKKMYEKIKGVRYIGYKEKETLHRGKLIDMYVYELFL